MGHLATILAIVTERFTPCADLELRSWVGYLALTESWESEKLKQALGKAMVLSPGDV